MNILFAATEIAPLVKVGGLADVISGLTKTLRMAGHRVNVVLPKFRAFADLPLARRLSPLELQLGSKKYEAVLYDFRLPSQVEVTLVEIGDLFDRGSVYGEGAHLDYPDNNLRFAAFSQAVAALVQQRAEAGNAVDVVHVHDWPTALVPWFLRQRNQATPTVLTIHNVSHQGVCDASQLESLGLDASAFTVDGAEFFGQINPLKLGILTAHAVTTVSPQYALEIQTPEHGAKLEGVVAQRREKLAGILNGIDYGIWNPATDSTLIARYDAENPAQKVACRGALQHDLGLNLDPDVPIMIAIQRMVHQKGVDLLAEAIPRIMRASDAQIVVAGEGDPELVRAIEQQISRFNGRAAYVGLASEPMIHKMLAAADIALMPSRFEPCGLVQMYAHRYGVVPVAHATGGLRDTIVDCDARLETGTGFLFQAPTAEALAGATERALVAYASPRFQTLVRRVMKLDRSWDRPSRRYEQVYRSLIKEA